MSLIHKLTLHPSFRSASLLISSVIAIFMKNSKLCVLYEKIVYLPIKIFSENVKFFLLDLVNEGMMTIFFLYIGLEIKYKLFQKPVNKFSYLKFSIISAIGGMLFPAILYYLITYRYPILRTGWAIPTTTDIVFSLSILEIIKNKFNPDLKIFLILLATIDDLFSIFIIAIFYTKKLNLIYLYISCLIVVIMVIINYFHIRYLFLYFLFGIILWVFLFLSGIHATLSGAITGIVIPNYTSDSDYSIIKKLLEKIDPYIKCIILPLFGFINSGIIFKLNFYCLYLLLPIGIILGLVFGKSFGITLFSYVLMKIRIFKLPYSINIMDIFSISTLCGIGFTMSIFIANIAFNEIHEDLVILSKIGILIGSFISAILGYFLINRLYYKNNSIKKKVKYYKNTI